MSTESSHEAGRQPETTGTPEPGEGGQAHGRPRSWLLVAVVLAAFVAGGVALIAQLWWLFWVCAAAVVLSPAAGRLIGIMNDTVAWVVPLERPYQPQGHILLGGEREEDSRTLESGRRD